MGSMSLSNKISMVEGHGSSNPYVFYTPAISSLCIPAFGLEDGPAGVADGLTGVTQLPAGVALAATWDPSLAQQYGQVIGAEEFGNAQPLDFPRILDLPLGLDQGAGVNQFAPGERFAIHLHPAGCS